MQGVVPCIVLVNLGLEEVLHGSRAVVNRRRAPLIGFNGRLELLRRCSWLLALRAGARLLLAHKWLQTDVMPTTAIISFTSNHLLPTIKPTEGHISVSTCAPAMAQEASETSVASSSVSANSRWEIHDDFPSTWSAINQWPQSSHRSISSCDEGLCVSNSSSFTNAHVSGERVENQLWNQVLL
ncbi:hypothetical protein BHM03_00037757 [Ensete ventricosum]|nr:hypothetical protein BHM03_00037757 [Ensete ventricosum]